MKLDSWRGRVLISFGLGFFRLFIKTLRFRVEDPQKILPVSHQQPFILAVWHNRLLLLPPIFSICFPHRHNVGLISTSKDGDIVAILVERFGHGTIRGSSSRKGVIALRQLVDELKAGTNVLITPDGPRGPLYEVNQGAIFLAQKSGAPIVPMQIEYAKSWRLKSWDGFFIPKPFSTVRIIFGAPLQVSDDLETERVRVQEAMMALVEQP